MNIDALLILIEQVRNLTEPAVIEADTELFKLLQLPLAKMGVFSTLLDPQPITNEYDLFKSLYKNCRFPNYFGFNWSAVKDCLADFTWHPASGYVLLYKNPGLLDKESFRIFIEIIETISKLWIPDKIPFKLIIPSGTLVKAHKDI